MQSSLWCIVYISWVSSNGQNGITNLVLIIVSDTSLIFEVLKLPLSWKTDMALPCDDITLIAPSMIA